MSRISGGLWRRGGGVEMTKRHLEIFAAVYESGSMTRAAGALFMTQPAVSQAIRELEEYYETTLFERTSRGLVPTEAGDELYRYSNQIAGLFHSARQAIQGGGSQVVRVGANWSIGTAFLPAYLKAFYAGDPRTRVLVRVSGYRVLLELLGEKRLDFALVEDSAMDAGLVWRPYYKDRLVIVAAPESPHGGRKLTFAEIAGENFLLREKGAGVRDRFDYLMFLRNMKIEPVWESATTTALVEAAKAGFGLAVLPYLLVRRYLEAGELIELEVEDFSLERTVHIVWPKERVPEGPAQRLIELIEGFDHRLS